MTLAALMDRFGFTWSEVRSLRVWEVNTLAEHIQREQKRAASEQNVIRR